MISVRMAEMAVSGAAEEELVAIGLGSCIGLAIVDREAGVAGLVHIVLPAAQGGVGAVTKFADTAAPALLEAVIGAGARRERLEVAIAGGAKMFAVGGALDIGARNDAAVREALRGLRLRISGAATGGNRGRTVRIAVGEGLVTVQEAGGERVALLRGRRAAPHRAGQPIGVRPAQTIGARA